MMSQKRLMYNFGFYNGDGTVENSWEFNLSLCRSSQAYGLEIFF
jgi:hypothetical protein